MVAIFQPVYLREPTQVDIEQLHINAKRGFLGMFVSLDCMHSNGKITLLVGKANSTNKGGDKSMILETITNQSLWICHNLFGFVGATTTSMF